MKDRSIYNIEREWKLDIIKEVKDPDRTKAIIRGTIYVQDEESSKYFIDEILKITNEGGCL